MGKAKEDSEMLTRALIALIDKLNQENKKEVFLYKSLRILHQAKSLIWRPHWLKLRRHILEKLREGKENANGS